METSKQRISSFLSCHGDDQEGTHTLPDQKPINHLEISAIAQETGEIDQAAFEANQKLSTDQSLDTLEAEINNTVILQEDFSDL